jgi:hypothetical protein
MLLFIDPTGGTNYDTIVCLTSVGISDSRSVLDGSSMCGIDKAMGVLDISYSFEGQHLQDPDTGKISGTNIRILLRNDTPIGWKLSPESPVTGDEIHEGTGYISDLSSSYAFDSVGTFSGTLQPFGTPTITIYGGGGGLVLGQSYQGGKIAYLDGTGLHGIILANDSSLEIWSESVDDFNYLSWDYGQGAINTTAILAEITNPTNSAAYFCDNYSNDGYTDWFMPCIGDINNIKDQSGFSACGIYGVIWASNDAAPISNAYALAIVSNVWSDFPKNLSGFALAIPARYF